MTTITASGAAAGSSRMSRPASSSAASIAVPHDSPARIPSSRVIRRAIANASRSETRTQRSTDRAVVGAREEVLAHALGQVRPRRVARQHAALGVGADHPERRVLGLQVAGDAADRAAGADRRDEVRDAAVGLRPDLGAGRALVRLGVGRVPVLVGLERAGDVARQPGRDRVVALGRLGGDVGGAQDDLGAVRAQQRLLLRRLLVGHDEDAAVALERGGDRQAVAGVAGRRLDDGPAGLEQARALGGLDHRQPDPVLHRAARVEHLELREQQRPAVLGPEVAGQPRDADQRRVAHEVEDRVGVVHRPRGYRRRMRPLAEQRREAAARLAAARLRSRGAVGRRDRLGRQDVERGGRSVGCLTFPPAARRRSWLVGPKPCQLGSGDGRQDPDHEPAAEEQLVVAADDDGNDRRTRSKAYVAESSGDRPSRADRRRRSSLRKQAEDRAAAQHLGCGAPRGSRRPSGRRATGSAGSRRRVGRPSAGAASGPSCAHPRRTRAAARRGATIHSRNGSIHSR